MESNNTQKWSENTCKVIILVNEVYNKGLMTNLKCYRWGFRLFYVVRFDGGRIEEQCNAWLTWSTSFYMRGPSMNGNHSLAEKILNELP